MALSVLPLLPAVPAAASGGCTSTFTWDSGVTSGIWTSASNWDLTAGVADANGIPDESDECAIISSPVDSVDVDTNTAVGDLTMDDFDAHLNGTAILTVDGIFTWFEGNQGGSGRTVISGTGALNVTADTYLCDTRTIQVDLGGSTTLSGPGTISARKGTTFINSGAFDIQNSPVVDPTSDDPPGSYFWNTSAADACGEGVSADVPRFHNTTTGVLKKTTTSGTAAVFMALDNDGIVDTQDGTLRVQYGSPTASVGFPYVGPESTGHFLGSSGGSLEFGAGSGVGGCGGAGSLFLGSGSAFEGETTIGFDHSGTAQSFCAEVLSGATTTFGPGENVVHSAFLAGDGDALVTGTLDFSGASNGGATMTGAGTTSVASGASLNFGASPGFTGFGTSLTGARTIAVESGGTVLLSESGYIAADAGTETWVKPGAMFEIRNDKGYYQGAGGPGTLTNDGAITKTAASGTSILDVAYGCTAACGSVTPATGKIEIWGSVGAGKLAFTESVRTGAFVGDHIAENDPPISYDIPDLLCGSQVTNRTATPVALLTTQTACTPPAAASPHRPETAPIPKAHARKARIQFEDSTGRLGPIWTVDAPTATVPVAVRMRLQLSANLPELLDQSTLQLFDVDGQTPIPDCIDQTTVSPDPCVVRDPVGGNVDWTFKTADLSNGAAATSVSIKAPRQVRSGTKAKITGTVSAPADASCIASAKVFLQVGDHLIGPHLTTPEGTFSFATKITKTTSVRIQVRRSTFCLGSNSAKKTIRAT